MQPKPPIVVEAIKALNIRNPIYRYEIKGRTVTFWLYAHREPVSWTQPKARTKRVRTQK